MLKAKVLQALVIVRSAADRYAHGEKKMSQLEGARTLGVDRSTYAIYDGLAAKKAV